MLHAHQGTVVTTEASLGCLHAWGEDAHGVTGFLTAWRLLQEQQQRKEGRPGAMAGAQCNPLYDDASLRLTPREHFSDAADVPEARAVPLPVRGAQPPRSSAGAAPALPARAVAGAAAAQLPGVNEVSSALTAYAPGGLSVLYENQAMRVEREELKAELKLISSRVNAPHATPSIPIVALNFKA